jgi:DNA replication protein DnaC
MSVQQLAEMLRRLGCHGMATALEDLQLNPGAQAMPAVDQMIRLAESEINSRDTKRVKRLIKAAKFKVQAAPEDIDYRPNRSLDRQVIGNLLSCDWIIKQQNTILTGLTGVGKTWFGCAFGVQACRRGLSVWYFRLARLLEEIEIARADGSLPKLRAQLRRGLLLILDDWGLTPLSVKARHDILELIDDRSGEGSVLITSQLPVDKWYDWINEPTVADAILARLIHSAHRIEFTGESMRKKRAESAKLNRNVI